MPLGHESSLPFRRPVLVLALLLTGQLLLMLLLGNCVQEDSFISFRYARNLVDGHGLVYNPQQRVEGYTNFLWTLLLAAGMALGLDPVPLSRCAGMVAGLALGAVVFSFARRWDGRRRTTSGLLAGAIVAASPAVAVEGVQGLETLFYSLLVTSGVLLGVEARRREGLGAPAVAGWLLPASLLLGAAALTRPEGVLVFGLASGAALGWRWRRGLSPLCRTEAVAVLLFVIIWLPFWFWRWHYYGSFFPNTFHAKTGGGLWQLLRGVAYLGRFLALNPILTLLTVAGVGGWLAARGRRSPHPRPPRPAGDRREEAGAPLWPIAGTVVIGYLLYVMVIGGDFKRTFRFITPVLGLWAVLLDNFVSTRGWPGPGWLPSTVASWLRCARADGIPEDGRAGEDGDGGGRGDGAPADTGGRASQVATVTGVGPRTLRSGALILLGAILLNGLVAMPSTLHWARKRAWDLKRRTACGRYLAEHAPAGAVLAIRSAGIIPYYSGLRTIDMWGLNDRHIGHRKMADMGRRWPVGHEKRDDVYVMSQLPTYYVDEWNYCLGEPVSPLGLQLWSYPELQPLRKRYRERHVPLMIDDGRGPHQYWFNFLEYIPSAAAGLDR